MIKKIRLPKVAISTAFLLNIVCFTLEYVLTLQGGILKLVKYPSALFSFFICAWYCFNPQNKIKKFFSDILHIGCVVVYFLIVSIFRILETDRMTGKTVEELLQLLLPYAFAFFIVNFLSFREISYLMKISLVITFLGYIIIKFPLFFDIKNFLSISITNSYSPFENAGFAEVASGISVFFIYYRKKFPIYTFFSCLFVFFVFKRVLMLQMFILLLLVFLKLEDIILPKKINIFAAIVFSIVTYWFNGMLQYDKQAEFLEIFGETPGDFTVTRVYRIWYPLSRYKSFGYGSTTEILGRQLELDLIKILMEIGIVGLVLFLLCFFSVPKNKLYTNVVFCCMAMNLLLASGLTSTMGWTLRIIAIATIVFVKDNRKGKYIIGNNAFVIKNDKIFMGENNGFN